MTILKHEIKQNRVSLIIWTSAISFLMIICILIYPEMKSQMGDVGNVFAGMGGFSAAFGMDRINFGEFMGFFCVECGNILGLGGAFFAALLGISTLAKEEKEHTAEFLLTHPNSRKRIVTEKVLSIGLQIIILNAVVLLLSILSVLIIGENPDWKELFLVFLAYFIMQIETAAICYGISAFLRRGTLGIGIGLAAVFYFLNLVSNLTDRAKWLKYITPFAYTEGADILSSGSLNRGYIAVGAALAVIGIVAAYCTYSRKDIAA